MQSVKSEGLKGITKIDALTRWIIHVSAHIKESFLPLFQEADIYNPSYQVDDYVRVVSGHE